MNSPTVLSVLSDVETPVSLFHKLSQDEPVAFLYESTEGDSRLARYSFIGVDPIKTISFKNGKATVNDKRANQVNTVEFTNPLHFLKTLLTEEADQLVKLPQFPFSGGLVGYMGYGATQYFENIPQQETDPFNVPDGFYGLYDSVILFDHQYRRISIISHRSEAHAQSLLTRLMAPSPLTPLFFQESPDLEDTVFEGVQGPYTEEEFINLVLKAKTFIQEGQVFQIVPSQRFSLPVSSNAIDIYRLIQAINPSPYAYYLKYPGFTYLGSSPETFIKCQDGMVTLRALAGTRPRGKTPQEDEALCVELKSNEKELAEHRMLVDLGRNDLGRMCQVGTINIGEIATLTKYTHVMHLATELTGKLTPEKTAFDVFQSCFPRGTVSGAPKIRAMNLLAQLEKEQRGVYSGVVGYFDFSGNMDGAIAIRSVLLKDNMAHVNAGAGVVYDSDPQAEYQETRNKAKSMIKAIKLAERIHHHAGSHY